MQEKAKSLLPLSRSTMEKPSKPKSKKAETKKILLNVDHEIDDRLNLVNEILGGGGYRAGKKTAVIRTALDEFLPSKQDLIRMKKTPDRHDWIIGKLKKRVLGDEQNKS